MECRLPSRAHTQSPVPLVRLADNSERTPVSTICGWSRLTRDTANRSLKFFARPYDVNDESLAASRSRRCDYCLPGADSITISASRFFVVASHDIRWKHSRSSFVSDGITQPSGIGRGIGRLVLISPSEGKLVEDLGRYPLQHPCISDSHFGDAEVTRCRITRYGLHLAYSREMCRAFLFKCATYEKV